VRRHARRPAGSHSFTASSNSTAYWSHRGKPSLFKGREVNTIGDGFLATFDYDRADWLQLSSVAKTTFRPSAGNINAAVGSLASP
jgi:hypothetical protein